MMSMMVEAALRSLVLAAIVGTGLLLLRVTNIPARKAAWTLVLVMSIAMPFLMRWPPITDFAARFAWVFPVHRSVAAAALTEPMVSPTSEVVLAAPLPADEASITNDATPDVVPMTDLSAAPAVSPIPAARTGQQWPPPRKLIPIVYLVGCAALLLRLLWGLAMAAHVWMAAEEISPLVAPEPNVRMSKKVLSPVTIGRGVVLPGNSTEWSHAKLRVVLAHERSHVRQMDFYLQLLAGLYTAFFWFSPLGWWLKRTLSSLGEAISDRAGLEAAASRSDYAGVLLEFAALPGRMLPGVAMARPGNLSRRVERLLNEKLLQRAFVEGRCRAVVSLLLIPAALFGVTTLVRVPGAVAQTETAPQVTAQQTATGQSNPRESQVMSLNPEQEQNSPAPPQVPSASADPVSPKSRLEHSQRSPAPHPPAVPAQRVPPEGVPVTAPQNAPGAIVLDVGPIQQVRVPSMNILVPELPEMKIVVPKTPDISALTIRGLQGDIAAFGPPGKFYFGEDGGMNGYADHFSSNGDSWAIVDGTGTNTSVSGSGMTKDEINLAQRMAKGPFLWFSHRGKSYIVDDPAIAARIQALYTPMQDLGRQQQALGVQQRVLGRMEEEIARQERSKGDVRIPDLSKEMAAARAALDSLQSEQGHMLSEQNLGELQAKLAEMDGRLGSLEARAAMQNHFGERMRALGERQRQLGDQEQQLGQQQKKLEQQAQQQVQSIIEQSLQNGKAAPLK